ncbi:MAG: hypothetical protein JSR96_13790 [Proteobacteria bacterium]|nr:hypothetical protein [Pseudomonadota bacterium]
MPYSLASALLILAAVGPQVIPIDDARFRVRVVYDDKSAAGHANAQLALISTARKNCKGRGVAVSEGMFELNKAEPIRRGREALELNEVYRCVAKN